MVNNRRSGANLSLLSINNKNGSSLRSQVNADISNHRQSIGDIITFNPTPQHVNLKSSGEANVDMNESPNEAVKKLYVYNTEQSR